jgi:Guanine nucleotide exchange factor in Golgi transport N-terminal
MLRGTRVVFLLLKQFSAELVMEAEVFLALLIKLVGGETEAGELRRG